MGDSAPQPNAQSLRNLLVGLSRFEQFPVAIQWARENHCVVDIKRCVVARVKTAVRSEGL